MEKKEKTAGRKLWEEIQNQFARIQFLESQKQDIEIELKSLYRSNRHNQIQMEKMYNEWCAGLDEEETKGM
jgi:hypothetical protein